MTRVIFGLLVVIGLACKGHHDAPPPPPVQRDLIVLSPGMAPLAPLRYALAKGTKTQLAIDVTSHVAMGELSSDSPPVHVTLELVVDDVLPTGAMKLTSTIHTVAAIGPSTNGSATNVAGSDAIDPTQAHVDALGSDLANLAFSATLAPDGTITDVKAPETTLPELAKAVLAQIIAGFQQLAMPLPLAPVGIGAKWQSARLLGPASAIAMTATTTIDLVGRNGSTITYAVASQATGSNQTVIEGSASVEVDGIGGSASGSGTIDLGKLAIDSSSTAELHMNMTTGSDRTPMAMTQTLRVSSH